MKKQLKEKAAAAESEVGLLRHDIRNQLSNINLAVEQLRYELPDTSTEGVFYLDTIANSCEIINVLLKDKG